MHIWTQRFFTNHLFFTGRQSYKNRLLNNENLHLSILVIAPGLIKWHSNHYKQKQTINNNNSKRDNSGPPLYQLYLYLLLPLLGTPTFWYQRMKWGAKETIKINASSMFQIHPIISFSLVLITTCQNW